jgi:hypothetical protein
VHTQVLGHVQLLGHVERIFVEGCNILVH